VKNGHSWVWNHRKEKRGRKLYRRYSGHGMAPGLVCGSGRSTTGVKFHRGGETKSSSGSFFIALVYYRLRMRIR
jgi:hypothetical protein